MKQNIISISNTDRISGNASNFICNILPHHNVEKIAIESIMIPFTWYNIDNNNNSFTFNDGLDRVITLTNGVYSASTLVNELQSRLNASPSAIVFTVTFNNISKKLLISGTATFTLDFSDVNKRTHSIMGFNRQIYSTATSHTSTNVININDNNAYINIYSRALTKYSDYTKTSSKRHCFLRIPNPDQVWGSYIIFENIKDQVIEFNSASTLSNIDFVFEDNNNNEIYFNGISDILINIKTFSKI
jgi:hypothetical protein